MKKIYRRLRTVLVVLAVGVVAAGLIAKYWGIPGIIASKIQSVVAKQWDGEVKVGAVEFSYSGPIFIRNMEIHDGAKRPWLHVGSVEMGLRGWPGVSPVLATVDVSQVSVNTHFKDGRLDLPVHKQEKPSSPPSDMSKYVDVQRLTARDISYTIADDQTRQGTWTFQQLEAVKQPGGMYKVSLTSPPAAAREPADSGQTISLSGSIDPKAYIADLALDGSLTIDSSRTAVVLRALDVPVIKGIAGRLHSKHAQLRGRLDDPSLLQLGGQIEFKGFQFEGSYGHIAKELDCTMKLDGRTIRIAQFSANGCGGWVKVNGQADIGANWTVTYRGMLDATSVDVPKLTEVVAGPGNKAQRGTLSLQVKFFGAGGGIRGSGLLGLNNADVMTLSIFGEIFRQMGLGQSDELRKSDVRTVFAFNGPQVIIERARLANPLSAMDVEKGGRINVRTRELNLYVIGVPLKSVEGILNLPVINIVSEPFRNLRDKLVRLHVQGDWSAPPSTIIKKEPVTDVFEGTVGFFKDVAKSGGKLGQGALKALDDVFRALGGDSF
jgi:hypothetical protein